MGGLLGGQRVAPPLKLLGGWGYPPVPKPMRKDGKTLQTEIEMRFVIRTRSAKAGGKNGA